MLQQCSHPNVVRYLGSYQGEEYLWVRTQDWFVVLSIGKELPLSKCFVLRGFKVSDLSFHTLADSDGVLRRWKCC